MKKFLLLGAAAMMSLAVNAQIEKYGQFLLTLQLVLALLVQVTVMATLSMALTTLQVQSKNGKMVYWLHLMM